MARWRGDVAVCRSPLSKKRLAPGRPFAGFVADSRLMGVTLAAAGADLQLAVQAAAGGCWLGVTRQFQPDD